VRSAAGCGRGVCEACGLTEWALGSHATDGTATSGYPPIHQQSLGHRGLVKIDRRNNMLGLNAAGHAKLARHD
jgi:hypothetical protein